MSSEQSSSSSSRWVAPLVSGLIGAGVAIALVAILGIGGNGSDDKTVVQQAPLARATGGANTNASDVKALTAREIYKRDAPGVAFISAKVVQTQQSPFDLQPQEQQGESTGSGFVLDKKGNILTNAHVVEGASEVKVKLSDEKQIPAKIVGKDVSSDLALLRIDPDATELTPLALGNSDSITVGDPTVAIGNPFGLERTLTVGVVSALQREIAAPNNFKIKDVIQTDAAINPGNSGGPLIDGAGKVIGINSQIATGGGSNGNVGIAFAVPINKAKQVIPQLEQDGTVDRAYLGVDTVGLDIPEIKALNLSIDQGALIQNVQPGSPAAKAGLKGGTTEVSPDGGGQVQSGGLKLGGDVIVSVNGKKVTSAEQLQNDIASKKPGDSVTIKYVRGDDTKQVNVKLAQRPDSTEQPG